MTKGLFISFEGGEGSGKSTLTKSLYNYLLDKQQKVLLVREPGYTYIGTQIRKILLDPNNKICSLTELLLYEASRAELIELEINPWLEEGNIIIADRFIDSSTVYQGYVKGLNIELVRKLNQIATKNIMPNITFLLDIDAKKGLERAVSRNTELSLESESRFEKEDITFHQEIRKAYLSEACQSNRWKVLDATRKSEYLFKEVLNELEERGYDY